MKHFDWLTVFALNYANIDVDVHFVIDAFAFAMATLHIAYLEIKHAFA